MRITLLTSILFLLLMSFTSEKKATLYPQVAKNIEAYTKEFDQIPEDRKKALKKNLRYLLKVK